MTFNARGWISVAQLIVFIPCAIASFIVCRRHGFTRSSGWIYTLILCIVRIAGSVCQLVTYTDESDGLITAVVILDAIGLSPLLFATLGMLSRLSDQIALNSEGGGFLKVTHFRVVQLVIMLGLILSIAGAASGSSSSSGPAQPSGTSKAGIILYIAAFVALMAILLLSLGKLHNVPRLERRVAVAVLCAAPFILVRLAYSVLAVFLHNHDFNIIDGSVVILVVMRVIEEMIVVFIYISLGYFVEVLSADRQGPIATRAWKDRGNKGAEQGLESQSYAPAPRHSEQDLQDYPPQSYNQRRGA